MYIVERIKTFLKGWKNQPSKAEVDRLCKHYRNEVMDREIISHFEYKEIENLVRVSHYAHMGELTAIEAALCLGHEAGRATQRANASDAEESANRLVTGLEKIQYFIESFSDAHKLYSPIDAMSREERENFYFHRDNMRIEMDCMEDYVIQATDNLNELRKNIGI